MTDKSSLAITRMYQSSITRVQNKTDFSSLTTSSVYGELLEEGAQNILDALSVLGKLGPDTVLYDLGSGLGKFIIHASLSYPDIGKIVGIEYSIERYKHSIINSSAHHPHATNIDILNKDFMKCDISDATIIYIDDTLHKSYDLFDALHALGNLPQKFLVVSPTPPRLYSKLGKNKAVTADHSSNIVLADQTYTKQRKFYIYNIFCM